MNADVLLLNEVADIKAQMLLKNIPFRPANVDFKVEKEGDLKNYFKIVYEKYRVLNIAGGKVLQFRAKGWDRINWLPLNPTNFYR